MEIRSKRQFFALWEEGVLGNRTLLWRRVADIPASVRRVGFRQIGLPRGAAGAWTLVDRGHAEATALEWQQAGREFIMDGSVPNDRSVMQGEVVRTERGMEGYLCVRDRLPWLMRDHQTGAMQGVDWESAAGLPPMRETMRRGWHRSYGYLETKLLVERYCDPSSVDDLEMLLELYPHAAIELTAFNCSVGVIPGRRVIFWEVRNY